MKKQTHLVEPVVLEPLFGDVLPGDDARDPMVLIQHHQVAQTHRAEKPAFRIKQVKF